MGVGEREFGPSRWSAARHYSTFPPQCQQVKLHKKICPIWADFFVQNYYLTFRRKCAKIGGPMSLDMARTPVLRTYMQFFHSCLTSKFFRPESRNMAPAAICLNFTFIKKYVIILKKDFFKTATKLATKILALFILSSIFPRKSYLSKI